MLSINPRATAQNWVQASIPMNVWAGIASSADGTRLVAVAEVDSDNNPGRIYTSTNSGTTWRLTTAPAAYWQSVASSEDGTSLVAANLSAAFGPGAIYTSTNGGDTWTTSSPVDIWSAVASSTDGKKLVAALEFGGIYTSTNTGASWQLTSAPTNGWSSVASSADGTRLVAVAEFDENLVPGGPVYISSDSGATWMEAGVPRRRWLSAASSADGSRLAVGAGGVSISSDFGATWREANLSSSAGAALAFSTDGNKLVGADAGIHLSSDGGINWASTEAPSAAWRAITISADGSKLAAAAGITGAPDRIYTLQAGAVVIFGHPGGLLVAAGASPTFNVIAFGAPPLSYQWESNGVPIPNQTNATLTLTNVTLSAAGGYSVWVSNNLGSLQSFLGSLTVVPAFVTTFSPSGISTTGAVIRGSVTAWASTTAWMEWGTSTNYGNVAGTTNLPGGPDPIAISAALSGLTGNQTYFYRTVASNVHGTVYGVPLQFQVGFRPTVVSFSVSDIATNTATAHATINPQGWDTVVYFQWGAPPTRSTPITIGGGIESVNLTQAVTNLAPMFFNPYSVVASNALGVTSSSGSFLVKPWLQASVPNQTDWAAAASSMDGTTLAVAARGDSFNPGRIVVSLDSGVTWTNVTLPSNSWSGVAMSADGTRMIAARRPGGIYVSADSGANWSLTSAPSNYWSSIASSPDGVTLVAAASTDLGFNPGRIYISTNSGSTWATSTAPADSWNCVAVSADGTRLLAAAGFASSGPIFISTNSGATWAPSSAPNKHWSSVASSADGTRFAAAAFNDQQPNPGRIYVSTNSGNTWADSGAPSQYWQSIVSSADGTRLIAAATNGIFTSRNGGVIWNRILFGSGNFSANLALSADGRQLLAAMDNPGIGLGVYLYHFVPPSAPIILEQPTNQFVRPGTNVTLFVDAEGPGPLRYQWQLEGTNVPNATNDSYSFTDASLAHHGNYRVIVTDDTNSVISSDAFIYVLVPPGIVTPPVGVTNLQGQTATFSVIATGAPPLGYVWRLFRQGLSPYTFDAPATLVITNVQPSLSGTFRVSITNSAGVAGSAAASLLVIPDTDTDGLPDFWETNYFGNATNASALVDADGDGLVNRDEYTAGTDPANPASVLKFEGIEVGATTVLQFKAVSNKTYTIQSADALSPLSWLKIADVAARTSNRVETITNVTIGPEQYYRIVTPQQP